MTNAQVLVLRLLLDNRQGLYGSDIVRLSNGAVSRGVVYTVLAQLIEADWARELEDSPAEPGTLPRTRHFITEGGRRALQDATGDGFVPSVA